MTRTLLDDDNHIVTYRGDVIENTHSVHAAIVDSTGKLLFHIGNPSRVTLIRSAAKPPQALAVVETGAFEHNGFDDADLALMCSSHSSEPKHIERAQRMLGKIQVVESDMRCGGHPSISPEITRGWIRNGIMPTALYNNCSGKHIGMMAGAKAMGASIKDYHRHDHPIQDRVKRVIEEVAGLKSTDVQWGIDGCNMPAPAYPIRYLAKTYATFAEAADLAATVDNVPPRIMWSSRIFNAMNRFPDHVAGEGRFCTVLMNQFKWQLIGKLGADGCYGIGIRASEDTERLGAEGALGLAVKIGDGNVEILYTAVCEILERLGIGTAEMREGMDSFHHPQLANTMGVVTGKVSFPFIIHSTQGLVV